MSTEIGNLRVAHLQLVVNDIYDSIRKLIFMILMSLIQIHHLTETSSSFTEQFYGLKRIHQQSLKHVKKVTIKILYYY